MYANLTEFMAHMYFYVFYLFVVAAQSSADKGNDLWHKSNS